MPCKDGCCDIQFEDEADFEEYYKMAIENYGEYPQMQKLLEELLELSTEVMKWLNGKPTEFDIASEVADVEIMLEQAKRILHITDIVEEQKEFKIDRQIKRMNGELK